MYDVGNNALLSYELHGDENLPVLLMLHGFIGSSQEWSSCIRYIQAECRCLVIDMPGHGKSVDLPDESWYTFDMTTKLILNLLKKLHINKCSILGYSMGGRIALNLVLRNPQFFNKAIIESATPGLKSDKERSDRLYADSKCLELLRTENISQFLETWYNQPLFQTLQEHPDYHYMLERRKQNNPEELAKALCGLSVGLQTQLWDRISTCSVPTVMLAGEYDSKYVKIAQEMEKLSGVITAKIIEKSGHCIHCENPDVFQEEVSNFLYASKEDNQ